jgi:O-antigen/teichoic acid export membrane protein
LPINAALVWWLTKNYGLLGAAASYTMRNVLETLVVWAILYRVVPFSGRKLRTSGLLRPALTICPMVLAGYFVQAASLQGYSDIGRSLLILFVYGLCVPTLILDNEDRAFLVAFYRSRRLRFREY